MLLNLLKLAGLDVEAKVAAIKAEIEHKARQATEHLGNTARQYSIVAGCFAGAAITALFAVIVGLIALYQWVALNYGQFVGFAVVGGLLVLVTAGLVVAATMILRTDPNAETDETEPIAHQPQIALPKPEPSPQQHFAMGDRYQPDMNTDQVFEPVFALVQRYIQMPTTGNPAVDDVLRQLGTTAQGAANEALVRGARLVQTGDQKTMLTILGSAAFFGWLMARAAERHRGRA
jgi:hypothetical protein